MAQGELRIQEVIADAAAVVAVEHDLATTAPANDPRGLFHALRYRDFALFWIGACLSNIGTWMQMIAQAALVYELSSSTVVLGLVPFAAQVPMILLTLVGGSLADRLDRRKMLLITQSTQAVTAAILAVLAYTGVIQIWHIILIALVNGTANGITIPTFQAMVGDLVPREVRGNAIALNSTQFHLSRSIGPAIAAGLFAIVQDSPGRYFGSALCFAVNALSFLAVIIALLALQHPPAAMGALESDWRAEARRFRTGLAEVFTYLRAKPHLEVLIHLTAITAFFGMPLMAQLPAYAAEVLTPLHPGEATAQIQGHLMTAGGIGSVIGALGMTALLRRRDPYRVIFGFTLAYAASIALIGMQRYEPYGWLAMFIMGVVGTTYTVIINTRIQLDAPDALRGRLMALYTLAFLLSMAIGNLITGVVAQNGRVAFAIVLNGLLMAVLILVGRYVRRNAWGTPVE